MVAISMELKLTAVVSVYAIFKLIEDLGILDALLLPQVAFLGYSLFTICNDGIFYVGHSYLYNNYVDNSDKVLKDSQLSTKEKLTRRYAMKSTMAWVAARAVTMTLVRNYFNHLPVMIATLAINFMACQESGILI